MQLLGNKSTKKDRGFMLDYRLTMIYVFLKNILGYSERIAVRSRRQSFHSYSVLERATLVPHSDLNAPPLNTDKLKRLQ